MLQRKKSITIYICLYKASVLYEEKENKSDSTDEISVIYHQLEPKYDYEYIHIRCIV